MACATSAAIMLMMVVHERDSVGYLMSRNEKWQSKIEPIPDQPLIDFLGQYTTEADVLFLRF